MQTRIANLTDAAALEIVDVWAKAQLRAGGLEEQCTPDVRQALTDAFSAPAAEEVSEGALARAALAVLAEDPKNGPMLDAMLDGPPPQRMGFVTTVAVMTAARIVLQTRVKIVHEDGRTTVVVDKPSTKDSTLLKLAAMLLGFAS